MGYSQIRHFLDSNEYTQVPTEWFLRWRIWDLRNKFWNKPNCTKSKSRTGMSRPKSVLVPTHIQSISGILVGKIGPTSVWTSLITNLITQAYFFGVFLWWAPFEGGKKCFTCGTDFAASRAFREAKSSATLNRILFDSKMGTFWSKGVIFKTKVVVFDRKNVFSSKK